MTDARAIIARFHGFRTIASHKEVECCFRLPLEDAARLSLLGSPGPETWCAIVRLDPEAVHNNAVAQSASGKPAPDKPLPKGSATARANRPPWKDRSPAQQCGALCADPLFRKFLEERHPQYHIDDEDDAAGAIRELCGIRSRAELSTKREAWCQWQLIASDFFAWKVAPTVVPA